MSDLRSAILRAVKRLEPYEVEALVRELEAVMPGWVAVTERLPERVSSYLISGKDRRTEGSYFTYVAWAFYNSDGKWSDLGTGQKYEEVTHWQPLPEVPHD